jgi:hypothetical protein
VGAGPGSCSILARPAKSCGARTSLPRFTMGFERIRLVAEMASESSEASFNSILRELCDGLAEISRRSLGR